MVLPRFVLTSKLYIRSPNIIKFILEQNELANKYQLPFPDATKRAAIGQFNGPISQNKGAKNVVQSKTEDNALLTLCQMLT